MQLRAEHGRVARAQPVHAIVHDAVDLRVPRGIHRQQVRVGVRAEDAAAVLDACVEEEREAKADEAMRVSWMGRFDASTVKWIIIARKRYSTNGKEERANGKKT